MRWLGRSAVLLTTSMIGPPGLRMPRDLIFGLSTLTRSKLCEHQAWLRHCTGDGRAYVRMLVAPPSGVRPPYPDAAPVDNLFKVLSSFSSFGISQHHVVRDLGGSMRRHVSFYRRMTRPHVQPSDLEHTTSPRLSVKVQARKADEHAKIARASQPVSCVGNSRAARHYSLGGRVGGGFVGVWTWRRQARRTSPRC